MPGRQWEAPRTEDQARTYAGVAITIVFSLPYPSCSLPHTAGAAQPHLISANHRLHRCDSQFDCGIPASTGSDHDCSTVPQENSDRHRSGPGRRMARFSATSHWSVEREHARRVPFLDGPDPSYQITGTYDGDSTYATASGSTTISLAPAATGHTHWSATLYTPQKFSLVTLHAGQVSYVAAGERLHRCRRCSCVSHDNGQPIAHCDGVVGAGDANPYTVPCQINPIAPGTHVYAADVSRHETVPLIGLFADNRGFSGHSHHGDRYFGNRITGPRPKDLSRSRSLHRNLECSG